MSTVTITSTVASYPKKWPYEAIKNAILGKAYVLSIAFVGSTRARHYNETYRQKTYVPNVLSFPLSDTVGEIILTPTVAKKEASAFGFSPDGYLAYLFIHGCLHLKGYDHGATMETMEKRYCKRFDIS